VVVIYIGINDVWHSLQGKGTPIEAYESGLGEIVERTQRAGARVILCTPSVIGEKTDGSNELDAALDQYSAASRRVAQQRGATLIDLRALFLGELKIRNPENRAKGVLTTDGVHLNAAGNEFVRDCLRPAVASVVAGRSVRHLVLVKFKSTATVAQINEVCDAFARLPAQIDEIRAFEHGADISVESRNQGFTHAFIVSFDDVAARDAYLVHPAHEAFKKRALEFVEDVLVVDILGRE
jgi:hypothetical protein